MTYQPPFHLTHNMTKRVAEISELIGAWKAVNQGALVPELRRGNRIKTIQASLAVEQNTLSLEQVTAVLEGKTVLGLPREIQEVRNAFAAYEKLEHWQPQRLDDLLSAHRLLMHGLVDDAGHFRSGGSGIYQGQQLVHMAPPPSQVARLMENLFDWLSATEAHPLIASTAFHYEFEFIHPFSDGNGRMGRLWQTLILSSWQPLLAYLPVETVIKNRQQDYYRLLGEADKQADCSVFIEFLLQSIQESLHEAIALQNTTAPTKTPVEAPVITPVKVRITTETQILELLRLRPELSLSEVAATIGRSLRAVERAVSKLKNQNRLAYEGSKKDGKWKVLP
ncbi:Fic family protein [Cellvibrio sp. OA-2007]|uniref:Fic family protein n=1 Tax=Cellvibrio sp. OA-2007 TaxID=529823 RepID=UPI0007803A25|nr:Fic family protein [Cellvibrio sp. OA-2007]